MMPEIKTILYATDLSKNSAYAFYYAVDIAQKRNAKIVILHVIEPVSPLIRGYVGEDTIVKIQRQNVEKTIEEINKRLQDFCRIVEDKMGPCLELVSDILVRLGHPVNEILRIVEKEQCDLIVLGSHGKGFLEHTFLGSVSRSVLDRTRKPVFIIPLPSEEIGIDWEKMIQSKSQMGSS
ncbi:MAG TPA: universal stress protein [Thermodesulfobacteriota bacterium]|nr:universal stress protein [Thermodesulfobacteriota bacterium]